MEEQGMESLNSYNLIIPKKEIIEELEITFENDCNDNKEFLLPKEELSNTSQHSDDEDSKVPINMLKPIKTEVTSSAEDDSQLFGSSAHTDTTSGVHIEHDMTIQIKLEPETAASLTEDCPQTNGSQFSDSCSQSQHAAGAKESKLNSCSLCEYTCKFKSRLLLHMMTHTGEKPFTCDQCEKKFIKKHHLNDHKRTHTGEKPYSCALCQRNFIQKQHLSDHMRTHTGEKSFSCNTCHTSFTKKCNLNSHILTHTSAKPFSCTLCPKKFGQQRHLNSHLKTHAGYKRFYCEICEKKFTHKRSHMRIHFRKEPYAGGGGQAKTSVK